MPTTLELDHNSVRDHNGNRYAGGQHQPEMRTVMAVPDPALDIPRNHRDALTQLIESRSSLLICIIGATIDFPRGETSQRLADVLIERVPKASNVDLREVAHAMAAIHLMRTTCGFSIPETSRLILDTIDAHRDQQALAPVGVSRDQALAVLDEVVHAASASLQGSDVSTAEIYLEVEA